MHMCAYGGQKMISGVTLRNMGLLFWDRFPHGLKLLSQPTQDIQEVPEILLFPLPYKHRPSHTHSGTLGSSYFQGKLFTYPPWLQDPSSQKLGCQAKHAHKTKALLAEPEDLEVQMRTRDWAWQGCKRPSCRSTAFKTRTGRSYSRRSKSSKLLERRCLGTQLGLTFSFFLPSVLEQSPTKGSDSSLNAPHPHFLVSPFKKKSQNHYLVKKKLKNLHQKTTYWKKKVY